MILALSDYEELGNYADAENMFAPEFQVHIETFLSYLLFWQDVMEHCHSVDVRATLKDHFRVLFLQQLLYPSLLESSDVDGGSSVAVLTYLRFILDSLDHPELVRMILRYLLALPAEEEEDQQPPKSPTALRRRMSLMLLTASTDLSNNPDPNLFSMVDLVYSGIESYNRQTVTSALKLVTIMFMKNHAYCLGTLLRVRSIAEPAPQRTHGALNLELEQYMSVAQTIGGVSGTEEAYEKHLKDALTLLESHPCTTGMLTLNKMGIPHDVRHKIESNPGPHKNVVPHRVAANDKLTQLMLNVLREFLVNDVETNLSLTEAFVALVSCPYLYLDGWMSIDPAAYNFDHAQQPSNMGSEGLHTIYKIRQRPLLTRDNMPPLLQVLRHIEKQIKKLRQEVPDFDQLVESRKQAFLIHDEIENATLTSNKKNASDRKRQSAEIPAPSRGREPNIATAAVDAILELARSQSPTRSASRGPSHSGTHSSPAPLDRILQAAVGIPVAMSSGDKVLVQSLTAEDVEAAHGGSLQRKIKVPFIMLPSTRESDDQTTETEDGVEASLTHILTNVVVLQEFILEITAILQVRATLFAEVKFA